MFQEFLFGLQNIVKLKYTLLDCWVRKILYMMVSKYFQF
ncbi:hypothetical protein T03_13786 [Trichinella britovi]|uniref:Uncharacterized protein n=1 Tax=Trichinella britovi TaxID=45882 RepID=A0A0V0YXC4_TRIBR|nr:hypothetical protein T03_13786 [Trichinella britovi]